MNVPFSIIGHFGDTISYLRLYLVGSSSVVLIKAFNEIAFGGDAPMTLGRGLAGAVIIFLVHLLNILLSALSVLVHGVRLNALEFSSHLGIQWLGRAFKPFRKESSLTP
jgi:V/A-type H+-transporting ATPase subunit I